jgi:peptide chain release factor 1
MAHHTSHITHHTNNIAILEIRPGAGGNEAKIWAGDLLRMYLRFAQNKGWKTQLLADTTLRIKGDNVYKKLKSESGVHRVQRIPKTERHGRIHTSTASVAVLPQISPQEVSIRSEDIDWDFFRASGAGGQYVNKTSSAVRLTHKPTGIVVTSQQERSQGQNRELALDLLRAKLWEKQQELAGATISDARLAIGRGQRAEKIRTYNYPQNRVTDHRINKKFQALDKIIDGNLDIILKKF